MTPRLRPLAAALAATLLLAAPQARAQSFGGIVYDPTSFAQMVKDAKTAIDQLNELKAQVQQGQQLFESLNEISDVNAIASQLGVPELRSILPDIGLYQRALSGDLNALGALGERADEIRAEHRLYTPPAGDLSASETYYRDTLEASGARAARDYATGERVAEAAEQRLEGLEQLRSALDTAPNARAVLDLQARISAEQAMIQNDQMRLQGVAMLQDAEDRLQRQRDLERAEAARAERIAMYQRARR
ncbi:type IV secretion system protein (plasmid) [Brevundimonas staleyi]|uniref:Type IV secretion system protein n=1 Tax=Brevundimonas staleyi TaxID=74326 RepID=A0ABW0FM95_9CAUL